MQVQINWRTTPAFKDRGQALRVVDMAVGKRDGVNPRGVQPEEIHVLECGKGGDASVEQECRLPVPAPDPHQRAKAMLGDQVRALAPGLVQVPGGPPHLGAVGQETVDHIVDD